MCEPHNAFTCAVDFKLTKFKIIRLLKASIATKYEEELIGMNEAKP